MGEEWAAEDPLSPGVGFPGGAPRRLEMESEDGEEADHGDAPWRNRRIVGVDD